MHKQQKNSVSVQYLKNTALDLNYSIPCNEWLTTCNGRLRKIERKKKSNERT